MKPTPEFMRLLRFFAFLALVLSPTIAAASGTSGGLPWEDPLDTVADSISGKTAIAIALIAIAAAGAMLIFGGEVNAFARTAVYIVVVLALLVTAKKFLNTLYGNGAAVPVTQTRVIESKTPKLTEPLLFKTNAQKLLRT